jgi:hypothetical protein
MRQDATIAKLEVIGQAVKHLSDGCKSRRPEIPWKQIAGMRNRDIANTARATCLGAPRADCVPPNRVVSMVEDVWRQRAEGRE